MKKIYNTFTNQDCFIKDQKKEDIGSDYKYHCCDKDGNTIWNGEFLYFPQIAIREIKK